MEYMLVCLTYTLVVHIYYIRYSMIQHIHRVQSTHYKRYIPTVYLTYVHVVRIIYDIHIADTLTYYLYFHPYKVIYYFYVYLHAYIRTGRFKHWNLPFAILSILICVIARFFNIFPLCHVANWFRQGSSQTRLITPNIMYMVS